VRVIGIMGSPRKGSNTDLLLDAALSGAAEHGASTHKLSVCDLSILPCIECYHCSVDGTCALKDDMTRIYESLVAADCIIIASPVFFYGLTAQMKALIDRCQALWVRRYVLKSWQPAVDSRKGGLISVGATRGPRLFDGIQLTAKYFFDAVGMGLSGELLVRGVDGQAQVRDTPDHLAQAIDMGRRLVGGNG
jgi:multimeric flavodoxin WrbA